MARDAGGFHVRRNVAQIAIVCKMPPAIHASGSQPI
jgi:hypothetical protein